MNKLRCRSKHSQIPPGIYDSGDDAIILQGFNSTIDGKTFGDASKIDNQPPSESNVAFVVENDVAPAPATAKPFTRFRKIVPLHELSANRDVENAIAFARKFLRTFQNAPCPRMNNYTFWESTSIDPRDIASGIMKTHQPIHSLNCRESAIDCAMQVRLVSAPRSDVNERAEERPRPPHFT